MKVLNGGGAPILAILLLAGASGHVAAQGQRGNDSADWCVVSGQTCEAKEKAISLTQGGPAASFTARLFSPDKLNPGPDPFPLEAYLAAGEWSSDCGEEVACGANPTLTIAPSTLVFSDFSQGRDFTVEVSAGHNVVPGEYSVKIKTFGPDNHHLNGLGWGFGSGIEVNIVVSAAGTCAPPSLTIVSPREGDSLQICQVNRATLHGVTPVGVSLEATSGITDFSAVVSRADGSNPSAVSLVKNLGVDPATATGTGSANGPIGSYKLTATATNACAAVTQSRLLTVAYAFSWGKPQPSTPNENANLTTKFSIRDCSGAFVVDPSVEVTITGGNGFFLTRTFAGNPNDGVTINTVDETYHTNLQLPAGQGVTYSVVVKFQGIQQGSTRTFTTKLTGSGK